jgi:4-hydroxy-4-methyl-2-oxoglutarate aldolase
VLADSDGAVFVSLAGMEELVATGQAIMERERDQADRARAGTSLRTQMLFGDFLARRADDPSYTFRQHLREVGGEIEE